MAQGGFSRDHQRAARARTLKAKEEQIQERQIIGKQVTHSILSNIQKKTDVKFTELEAKVRKTEEKLVLKQDEIVSEFIQMTYDRNRLLKFLLWTNFGTLVLLSFTLGYFL